MARESDFYKALRNALKNDFFMQRIETTTGAGVPDLFISNHSTFHAWIELKALPTPRPYIRPAQWAWMHNNPTFRGPVLILNRHPSSKLISCWQWHEQMQVRAATGNRVILLDDPLWQLKDISKLSNQIMNTVQ